MPDIEIAEAAGHGPDGAVRPSEDVLVLLDNAVVLLDGATSLRPELPSGGWYATELATRLRAGLTATPDADLADVLADAIAALTHDHDLVPGSSPSSTVAMLRWSADWVDGLVLADSPVVAFTTAGPHVLADERLATLPRQAGGYRDRLRAGGGYGADHVAAVRASGRRYDTLRNVDGGFWVAEATPAAAQQARRARWPRADVHAALLASDGVSCGVDDYQIFADWSAVLDLAETKGPAAVLDTVRAAERADAEGKRWPRPKAHDDQALALIRFSR